MTKTMPKKKQDLHSVSTVPLDDPATLAQREAHDKNDPEIRRSFEQGEMILRRNVESMENIAYRIILFEKEKRLDHAGWMKRTSVSMGPFHVFIKLLTGNRAVSQLNLRIVLPNENASLLLLKTYIRDEAIRLGYSPAQFTPSCQTLFVYGKEISVSDDSSTTMKLLNVVSGVTLQLALAVRPEQAFPSQIPMKLLPIKPISAHQ